MDPFSKPTPPGLVAAEIVLIVPREESICTEVCDSEAVFGEGKYVGHDEPSTLFYSNAPGSGNQMRYQLTLPKNPSPSVPRRLENLFISSYTRILVRHGDVRHTVLS
jgi:hypothetical protein